VLPSPPILVLALTRPNAGTGSATRATIPCSPITLRAMTRPLLAVDAPFLLYRSFFALPDSIHGADGRSVNALLGGANVLLRVAADRRPRAIVLCFGAEAAAYRVKLYPPYHASRPPVPDPLAWQFEQAPAFFAAFGWSEETSADLEADDLLGSFASAETAAGGETLIMTGDRDMYQCASERVRVLSLKSGISGFEELGPDAVRQRYGVGPELVPDFIALRGDPSDGLPGAAGVGPKTAAELLARHGSLEGAIAAAAQERPRIAAALSDSADQLRAFREIATLRPVALTRPPDRETDLAGGARVARELGLNRLAERLDAADSVSDL
jgi:5'-3' exonuclease